MGAEKEERNRKGGEKEKEKHEVKHIWIFFIILEYQVMILPINFSCHWIRSQTI